MKKPLLTSVVGLLLAAGVIQAQPPHAPDAAPAASQVYYPAAENCPTVPVTVEAYPDVSFVTADMDYLLWWVQKEHLVPNLFTSDPFNGPGILGNVDRQFRDKPLSGARLTLGYWLEDHDPVLSPTRRLAYAGVEVSGFFLAERSQEFLSGPASALVRPFFNLNDATTSGVIVAAPGLAVGNLSGEATFELWGVEANGWYNVASDPPGQACRADLMVGFRYLKVEGSLQINQNTLYNDNLAAFPAFLAFAGDRLQAFDYFAVDNQFYGGQIGARMQMLFSCGEVTTTFKYALGNNHQRLRINGGQLLTAPDGAQTRSEGGLLALASNIGEHTRNRLAQIPEASINLTLNMTRNISFQAGYTALYVTNVIRASDQIDRVIDISQIPNFPGAAAATPTGLGRPAVLFKESGLIVQGLDVGLKFSW